MIDRSAKMRLVTIGLVAVTVTASALTLRAAARADAANDQPAGAPRDARAGAQLYQAACANCHGADGRGAAASRVGFDTPLPDFTDCRFASREAQADWHAVVHQGGPVRAFDAMMPAFGDALSDDEIARVLGHVKRFCASQEWPQGELNLPRPLVTEKAYPEDEAIVATSVDARGPGGLTMTAVYERRIGARQQVEVVVPFVGAAPPDSRRDRGWRGGVGDIAIATKRAIVHSLSSGRILSVGAEVVLPTGDREDGLGAGTTIVEPFVAFGQILRTDGFLHLHAGLELPADTTRAGRELFWRAAVGRTFAEGRFGRAWSPMIEVLGARELTSGERIQWDVVPQVQVSLSRRQHVLASAGVSVPLTDTADRHPQVLAYVLWDWFDGGIFQGW